ncbi:transcriptional regulator [Pelobium manganitolerans]|uniref:Transcriptional regulator n=1 Tax=Pelobium manganitolerans TaxID=1842495 RepID=A0A419S2X4_9SPHI|nr:response regulator [Pelobium manganitolerans]RKD13329.1 transcriptional regulator [Pelobium manganitolerans]
MVKATFIIDDDEVYVYAIKRLINLKQLSEQVLVFKNGQLALDYLINTPADKVVLPDVILLDVRMPVLDGWGFLEAYAELNIPGKQKVDIYMVSSSIDPRDLEKAANIPIIKRYLFKPVNLEDLKNILEKR